MSAADGDHDEASVATGAVFDLVAGRTDAVRIRRELLWLRIDEPEIRRRT